MVELKNTDKYSICQFKEFNYKYGHTQYLSIQPIELQILTNTEFVNSANITRNIEKGALSRSRTLV